jgi:nucleotide-binding universal stress UspA family protein
MPRNLTNDGRAPVAGGRLRQRGGSLLKTIVVAYDDPESATLGRAAALAELADADLIVTNAVGPIKGDSADEAARSAETKLAQARRALAGRELRAEFVPSVGPPAQAIVRLAEERSADLIVVGTRKKGFFERLVEGSVNREVLERAKCDVLVVY